MSVLVGKEPVKKRARQRLQRRREVTSELRPWSKKETGSGKQMKGLVLGEAVTGEFIGGREES